MFLNILFFMFGIMFYLTAVVLYRTHSKRICDWLEEMLKIESLTIEETITNLRTIENNRNRLLRAKERIR